MVKSMVYTENVSTTLNHHKRTPFHDEGEKEARYSKPEPDLTQCFYIKII